MHLFPPELEIGPDDGFVRSKDIFDRAPFGEKLTRMVQSIEDPLVLLLDGAWGTGKTTFIKMWLGELSKLGVPTIYFDAFANDYHEDAFLTIAGEIISRAEELKPRRTKSIRAFKTTAIQVAKALGRASLKIGIRTVSAGVLTGDEIAEGVKITADAAKVAGDEAAKAIDELVKDRLESHKADREAFEQFREALAELPNALSNKDNKNPTTPGSSTDQAAPLLVFVIDELDRCRPPFALDLLEKIKYFFSVAGVTFVLISSLKQLESAARFAYGDIDARTYLEKFYHLRILFPSDITEGLDETTTVKYLKYLFPGQGGAHYIGIIAQFCRIQPLSLRTLERIVAYTKIASISIPGGHLCLPQIITGLCIMKVIQPDLYTVTRNGGATFEEVDALFRLQHWRDEHQPDKQHRLGENVENWWRYSLGALTDDKLNSVLRSELFQYSFQDPSHIIPYFCKIVDGFVFP